MILHNALNIMSPFLRCQTNELDGTLSWVHYIPYLPMPLLGLTCFWATYGVQIDLIWWEKAHGSPCQWSSSAQSLVVTLHWLLYGLWLKWNLMAERNNSFQLFAISYTLPFNVSKFWSRHLSIDSRWHLRENHELRLLYIWNTYMKLLKGNFRYYELQHQAGFHDGKMLLVAKSIIVIELLHWKETSGPPFCLGTCHIWTIQWA